MVPVRVWPLDPFGRPSWGSWSLLTSKGRRKPWIWHKARSLSHPPRYFYTSLIVLAMSSHRGSTLFNGFLHLLPCAMPYSSLSKPIWCHYPSERPLHKIHMKNDPLSPWKALEFLDVFMVCSWSSGVRVSWLAGSFFHTDWSCGRKRASFSPLTGGARIELAADSFIHLPSKVILRKSLAGEWMKREVKSLISHRHCLDWRVLPPPVPIERLLDLFVCFFS
jgi:hypothetical protein